MTIDPVSAISNTLKSGFNLGGKIVGSVTRLKLAKSGDAVQREQNASEEFKLAQSLQHQYTSGDPGRTWLDMTVDNLKRMIHPLIAYPFIALFWIYILSPFFRFIESPVALQLINDYIAIINSLGAVLPLVLGSLLGVRQLDKAMGLIGNFKTSQLAVKATEAAKKAPEKSETPAVKKSDGWELSKKGMEALVKLEGAVKQNGKHAPYDDQTGEVTNKWVRGATIGYGHLIKDREEFEQYKDGIGEDDAVDLLDADLGTFEKATNRIIRSDITQGQFDACVIFAFNIGIGGFRRSTAARMINKPNIKTKYEKLEDAWKAWNKSQGKVMAGLENRRAAEWDIYNNKYPV